MAKSTKPNALADNRIFAAEEPRCCVLQCDFHVPRTARKPGPRIQVEAAKMPMENALALVLAALIALVCVCVVLGNQFYSRKKRKQLARRMEELESLKEQGTITEEQYESLRAKVRSRQEPQGESCTLSAEELMEGVDAALDLLRELESNRSRTGERKWAEAFGIRSQLDLSLRELTLISMKMVRPREATNIIAEILAMNIPIDALEIVQKEARTT